MWWAKIAVDEKRIRKLVRNNTKKRRQKKNDFSFRRITFLVFKQLLCKVGMLERRESCVADRGVSFLFRSEYYFVHRE